MQDEQEIRRLMQTGMEINDTPPRARRAVSLARRQVGQRDTLSFVLIRIWAALARLVAPFFARFGEMQAQAIYRKTHGDAGLGDGGSGDEKHEDNQQGNDND